MLIDYDIAPLSTSMDSNSNPLLKTERLSQPRRISSMSTRRRTKKRKEASIVPPPPSLIAQFTPSTFKMSHPEGGYFDKIEPPAFNCVIS